MGETGDAFDKRKRSKPMKRYMMLTAICVCLLVGSLYPRMILDHHVRLVDETGREMIVEGEYSNEIPVKLEFAFLRFFR